MEMKITPPIKLIADHIEKEKEGGWRNKKSATCLISELKEIIPAFGVDDKMVLRMSLNPNNAKKLIPANRAPLPIEESVKINPPYKETTNKKYPVIENGTQ